ncbi:MAG: cation:proton antiporter [Pirellulaceae bacterium]
MDETQQTIAVLASIFVLGIGGHWLAWRLNVPAILLLLLVGFTAGPLTGWIDPEAIFGGLLLPLVSMAVALILFEGGVNLRFRELRGTWASLIGLLTVGVLVTWGGATMAGIWLLQLPIPVAMVLGAILTVTGPTVIGPLLRDIRPKGRAGVIAKWEGIIVDPIGATLALLVFEAADAIRVAEFSTATRSALAGQAMVVVIGLTAGLVAAVLLVTLLRRFWIPDYLQNPITLMFVVVTFTGADLLHHEAGLLAVTVLGITLANQQHIDVHRIIEFKENLSIVLIAMLFIVLSARMPLDSLTSLGWRGPAFVATMIQVLRPAAVWISTIGSGLTWAERCFLSWLAPRGIVAAAVSSVFALRLGDEGAAIAPATFLVIFGTVAVYGLSAGWVARQLGLSTPDAQGLLLGGASQLARAIAATLVKEGFDVVLVDTRYTRVRRSRESGLTACFANILSQQLLDEVDLGGLGRFLALTSNDEVNTLAAARFREWFGRDKVFQLPKEEARHSRMASTWQTRLVGRMLFGPGMTYEYIDTAIDQGATIKVTRLSATFDFAAFQAHYGVRAIPLFVIDGKRLHVVTTDTRLQPKPGQSLVSLVAKGVDEVQVGSDPASASSTSAPP